MTLTSYSSVLRHVEGQSPPHPLPNNRPLEVRTERARHPHLFWGPTIWFEYVRRTNEDAHASCPRGRDV